MTAPISSGFLFQSTYDFGQFELQRGPQGTLRGRASPSGSIAVTTRRPDLDEIGFVANATATDLSAYKFDGALNIPIIKDVLAIRLAGVLDYNKGNRVHSIKEVSDPRNNEGPYRRTQSIVAAFASNRLTGSR
jgi:iron complex outermembrane receptor protein